MSSSRQQPAGENPAPRQSRRDEILAAAVASVVSDGYGRTTMAHVARRAAVARPLVQYYFPTRELMLRAAIARILDDWHYRYLEAPGEPGERTDIGGGVERLWRHMHEPAFRAYQELQSAARTDPALRAIIDELGADAAHRRYDQAAATYAAFASADSAAFTDARAFTTIFLEGLLHHRFGTSAEESTADRQLAMLTELLVQYWSRHGVAADAAGEAAPPALDDDIRHHAAELIVRLQALIKTAG